MRFVHGVGFFQVNTVTLELGGAFISEYNFP